MSIKAAFLENLALKRHEFKSQNLFKIVKNALLTAQPIKNFLT